MSERTHAPRPGGRAAEQRTGSSRDAETPGGAARGARRYPDGADTGAPKGDTRRSGTGRDEAEVRRTRPRNDEVRASRSEVRAGRDEARAGRAEARAARDGARSRTRDTAAVRGETRLRSGEETPRRRDTAGVRGESRTRDTAGVRARDTAGVRARDTGSVRGRDTGGVRTRDTGDVRGKGRERAGTGRGLNPATARRIAGALSGRGRRPVTDAPVDGTAALQVEVATAEPIRVTDTGDKAPRLRVAPPAPINTPRAPFIAGVLVLVVVGVIGILLINTKTNENSFRITDLQKQNTALENQHQDLENQLVEASSVGNLDAAARRLGLVKAENLARLRLPDGKTIGVPRPVVGQPGPTAQDAKTDDVSTVDKGSANISPVDGQGQANGLTPNGTDAATSATGTGTAGTGRTGGTGTGTGTGQTGTTGTGTGEIGTTGTGTGQTGAATGPTGTGQ